MLNSSGILILVSEELLIIQNRKVLKMIKLKDMPLEKQVLTLKIALTIAVSTMLLMMICIICVTCIVYSCSQMLTTSLWLLKIVPLSSSGDSSLQNTTDFQLIRAGALLGCSLPRLRLTFLEKSSKEGYNTCIRLGLCDNSQMIPFLITGTDLFHRPLFFLSRQKPFPCLSKTALMQFWGIKL